MSIEDAGTVNQGGTSIERNSHSKRFRDLFLACSGFDCCFCMNGYTPITARGDCNCQRDQLPSLFVEVIAFLSSIAECAVATNSVRTELCEFANCIQQVLKVPIPIHHHKNSLQFWGLHILIQDITA